MCETIRLVKTEKIDGYPGVNPNWKLRLAYYSGGIAYLEGYSKITGKWYVCKRVK